MSIVLTKQYSLPEFNINEILRYCGAKAGDLRTENLIYECITEIEGRLKPLVCFCEFDIAKNGDVLDLGFIKTQSKLLIKHLSNSNKIVLFAATVGLEIDRLILKYGRISPLKAVIFQGLGAERIEALCDVFQNEVRDKYGKIAPRVSAGYGDIPIQMQRDIFAFLDCPRKIGLSLNESMLMSPTKSVTAIIGVNNEH